MSATLTRQPPGFNRATLVRPGTGAAAAIKFSGARARLQRLLKAVDAGWLSVVGVVFVSAAMVSAWPETSGSLTRTLMLGAAVSSTLAALVLARHRREIHDQLSEVGALEHYQDAAFQLSTRALESSDLSTFLMEATELVAETIDVEYCGVLECVPEDPDNALRLRAGFGWPDNSLSKPVLSSHDASNEPPFAAAGAWQAAHGVRSGLSIALRSGGHVYGLLDVYTTEQRVFTTPEARFVERAADVIGAVMNRDQAAAAQRTRVDELAFRALHDPLTGLPNRALLEDRLRQTLAQRDPLPAAVLFIDLDAFKAVNDRLGHAAGDKVLIQVAERLKGCVRQGDTAARFGGDEFVVVLEPATDSEVAQIAARIRNAIAEPILVDGHRCQIGASVGIALTSHDTNDVDALLHEADVSMYRAKHPASLSMRPQTWRFHPCASL